MFSNSYKNNSRFSFLRAYVYICIGGAWIAVTGISCGEIRILDPSEKGTESTSGSEDETAYSSAFYAGDILYEGTCGFLAGNGWGCSDGRPLFTCDYRCENGYTCDDNDHWMAVPANVFNSSAPCGTQFKICVGESCTWGYVRDKSCCGAFEVSPGILRALGQPLGTIGYGTIYLSKSAEPEPEPGSQSGSQGSSATNASEETTADPQPTSDNSSSFNLHGATIASVTERPVILKSQRSGKCLDLYGWNTKNGATITQWKCHGKENQQWKFIEVVPGMYKFQSVHSGKAVDVLGASVNDGARVSQWEWHGGNNQIWLLDPVEDGYFEIRSLHSDKCLDIHKKSKSNGALIKQWRCHGGSNQRWRIYPVE